VRLLVWNIEKFSFNRISPLNRHNYVNGVISPVAAARPDIIAIIEVVARGRPLGSLLINTGMNGTWLQVFRLNLLTAPATPWRVVPPLSLTGGTRAEAISVFYNSTTVNLIGPNVWAGPALGSVPIGAAPAAPYGGIWGGPTVAGANTFAGRCQFNDVNNNPISFPTALHRRPWFVRFQEVAPPARTFNLFFVHTSPFPVANCVAGVQALWNIPEITAPPVAGQVDVVAGDFNIDAIGGANFLAAYGPLMGQGYVPLIPSAAASPSTMLQRRKSAQPPLAATVWPNRPRYKRVLSLDNILVRDGGAVVPAPQVIDRVDGTPTPPFVTAMATPIPAINFLYPPPNVARYTVFRAANNFRHIRETSDHLPVVVNL